MANILLTTKFALPQPPFKLVARPRLVNLLNSGLDKKLILLAAPAGFGKTTLVTEWLYDTLGYGRRAPATNVTPYPVAWLSLDENDNDPIRFLTYCVAALQQVDATLGASLTALLQAPTPPALEVLLAALINDVAKRTAPLLFILDDYHLITTPLLQTALAFLIDNMPRTLQLLITSRSDPPLPLSRWRVRRELVEIRAHDLRFTQAEAATFLQQELGIELAAAEIAALDERTEGWIAGLQLAALSMAERQDVREFIQAFTGSHAYVVDYLLEEVLRRQPPAIEQFLLQTALLERLCAPLCDVVLEQENTQALLEQLDRANLFLIPLDNERRWYRYHHLFADVLQSRLRLMQPQFVPVLHRRASGWFAAQGWPVEAIAHARQAQDRAWLSTLIEQQVETLLKRGETMTLQRWLDDLPVATLRARPRLSLTRATLCIRAHLLDEAEEWVQTAEQAIDPATVDAVLLRGEAIAIRVNIALNRHQLSAAIALSEQALVLLPTDQLRLRGEVMMHQGLAYLWSNQLAQAAPILQEASRLSAAAGDNYTAVLAMSNQANVLFMQGQLQATTAMLQRALGFVAERAVDDMPITATIHQTLAEVYYEKNELAHATHHAREAVGRAQRSRNPRLLVLSYVIQAQVAMIQGEADQAQDILAQAYALLSEHQLAPRYLDEVLAARIKSWLRTGNLGAATAILDSRRTTGDSARAPAISDPNVQARLQARVYLAQRQFDQALPLLAPLLHAAEASGNHLSLLENLALSSVAFALAGQKTQALRHLARALKLAAPYHFIRTFVDEGDAMRGLLVDFRAPNTDVPFRAYLDQLLEAFGTGVATLGATPTARQDATAKGQPLIEPLSERELEVLHLIAEGLSDRQVAERLIVVVGTVKRHLNNLYGKLGVHSRTQALARAKALGLL